MLQLKASGLLMTAFAATFLVAGCANVVRVAPHTELKVIDPVWTTAYITRNHAYLVYDTLFSLDENFEPQPQMVDKWSMSEDGKTWTFTLRDGLKWHDGTDVTADDCIASLQRWAKRDGVGQQMFRDMDTITASDAKTFSMQFRKPTEYVLEALAKLSANVPFMMPKRVAQTDAFTEIQDATGSGPFELKRSASVPGSKTVYVKNTAYVPRKEPQSLAAGGKVAKADRIEWIYYPDQAAALTALADGKVDYVESPPARLVPSLEGRKDIVVASTDPLGNVAMVRFNTVNPPFDKIGIRRAVLKAIQQDDYMTAALGDARFWRNCYSVFPCGTPMASETASDLMKPVSVDVASKMLVDAGYDGTPVVILNPVDSPVISAFTKVTAEKLQRIGMKVQVQDMTWAELTERRASREPSSAGGWSLFHTWWLAADVMDPTAIVFSGDPVTGWYGWPKDDVLESLRASFLQTKSQAERQQIAAKVQQRILETGVLGILGQFFEPVAYSSKVQGITTPVQFYWNMYMEKEKK
ncbi:MAG: ABC transporter substrate-binding protein [Bacteroidota bacterium]